MATEDGFWKQRRDFWYRESIKMDIDKGTATNVSNEQCKKEKHIVDLYLEYMTNKDAREPFKFSAADLEEMERPDNLFGLFWWPCSVIPGPYAVLVYVPGAGAHIGHYGEQCGWTVHTPHIEGEPTHWMVLPQPPQNAART